MLYDHSDEARNLGDFRLAHAFSSLHIPAVELAMANLSTIETTPKTDDPIERFDS